MAAHGVAMALSFYVLLLGHYLRNTVTISFASPLLKSFVAFMSGSTASEGIAAGSVYDAN